LSSATRSRFSTSSPPDSHRTRHALRKHPMWTLRGRASLTSEHAFDEQEARRLIETALGAEDRFAGLVERAEQSATAFATAADAYVRDDLEGSSAALAEYTNHANTHAQGCYDLCCAGAAATAALFAGISGECGHVECGVRLDSVDAPDLMTRWA